MHTAKSHAIHKGHHQAHGTHLKRKYSLIEKILKFLEPTSRKILLALVLTAFTYAGLSQTLFGSQTLLNSGTTSAATRYDFLVYDDTTAGVSSIKAISETAKERGKNVSILWLHQNPAGRKAMAENGIGIEDLFSGQSFESGNQKKFRRGIDGYYGNTYRTIGRAPYVLGSDRQSFEPQAAKYSFDQMLSYLPNVTIDNAYGYPMSYSYDQNANVGTVVANDTNSYRARYFIDSSIEADLARHMGADYRLGANEKVFNDKSIAGKRPIQLTDVFACTGTACTNIGPQSFTLLLTLKESNSSVGPIAEGYYPGIGYFKPGVFTSMYKNPATGINYDYNYLLKQFSGARACDIDHMLKTPLPRKSTPGGESGYVYEFNQSWNDYRIPEGLYDWYKDPGKRDAIRVEVGQVQLQALYYMQTMCTGKILSNSSLSVSERAKKFSVQYIPNNVYARGEMRIVGNTYLTTTGKKSDSIAIGNYNTYDRHLADYQSLETTNLPNSYGIEVPFNALIPGFASINNSPGLGNLVVPSAISTDFKMFNTSVRMEATRMYMGEAAGTAAVLARTYSVKIKNIKGNDVQAQLHKRGVRVFVWDVTNRNQYINESPFVTWATPNIDYSFRRGTSSVTLKAYPIDPTNRISMAFRLTRGNSCSTAKTSSFTALKASSLGHSYTFTGLAPGTYIWSGKAKDARYGYSIGNDFCGSDGWFVIRKFTIQ